MKKWGNYSNRSCIKRYVDGIHRCSTLVFSKMEIKATMDCEGSETLPYLQATMPFLLRCFLFSIHDDGLCMDFLKLTL